MVAIRSVAAALALAWVAAAVAQQPVLRASTDRATVRENESFTYVVRAEGPVRGEPELGDIERDFDILDTSRASRVQIVNGQIEQVAEWQYQMMPSRSGRLTLPPVRIGGAVSNAVELEVLPVDNVGSEVADIFMEVEAEPRSAYVQSQVIFTLRLFVGIGTGRAMLTAPEVSGGEAIVERLGEDSQYQTVRDGRNFSVRERRYAVFPQQTGKLTLGPTIFEAMVIPTRGFSRVQRFRSDTVEVDVLPAVSPPSQYPNAVWLPASRVEITERWSDDADPLELGIPRTRTLTIEADGLLQTQLPELQMGQIDGIRQYPDQPELDAGSSAAGMTVSRTERFAVMPQREGSIELPAVELPWWNITEQRWEVARIEPRRVEVLPSAEVVVEPSEQATAPPPETVAEAAAPGFWPYVSAGLAIGWLTTLALWWRSTRPPVPSSNQTRTANLRWRTNRQLVKQLKAACGDDDALTAHSVLMEWAALRFPDDVPKSLGALAEKLPDDAALAIAQLEASLYGQGEKRWSGGKLRAAFDRIEAVAQPRNQRGDNALLPLYR